VKREFQLKDEILIVMKNVFVLASFLSFLCSFTYAQTAKDVFSPQTNITWLGLDFTGAKLIGDREKYGSEKDIKKMIQSWNRLMIDETEKYDVGEALGRPPLKNAIEWTIDHNDNLNPAEMVTESPKGKSVMNRQNVAQIVNSYDFKSLSGNVGLLFVVESFSKLEKKSIIWITFINLTNNEILFTERMTAAPFGSGLRNYWAGAVNNTIKQIKTKYSAWEKKYSEK